MTGSSRHCVHVDREVGLGQPEAMKGAATRRILELIRELDAEGLV